MRVDVLRWRWRPILVVEVWSPHHVRTVRTVRTRGIVQPHARVGTPG